MLTDKQLAAITSCPALAELKDWFIAMDNEDEPAVIKKYWFLSYGDSAGEQPLDKGTAKTTGQKQMTKLKKVAKLAKLENQTNLKNLKKLKY